MRSATIYLKPMGVGIDCRKEIDEGANRIGGNKMALAQHFVPQWVDD
jgi:hypothetical protein